MDDFVSFIYNSPVFARQAYTRFGELRSPTDNEKGPANLKKVCGAF
jgi:hypothetical protein